MHKSIVNLFELNEALQSKLPKGFVLGPWFDPPNRLTKVAFISYRNIREPVEVSYWNLKMRSLEEQYRYILDQVLEAAQRLNDHF